MSQITPGEAHSRETNAYILEHWATWACARCCWTVPEWAREELICVALIRQHIREHDGEKL